MRLRSARPLPLDADGTQFTWAVDRSRRSRPGLTAELLQVAVLDEAYGERIAAFVVARKGGGSEDAASVEAVLAHLARDTVPREWHVVEELPGNPGARVLERDFHARDVQATTVGK